MTLHSTITNWQRGKHEITALRERVFVYERHLPHQVEFDQHDSSAIHALIKTPDNTVVATGRIIDNREISRLAVARTHRNLAVYKALFSQLFAQAKQTGANDIVVACTLESVGYHECLGYQKLGNVYMEAGIPRQRMCCKTARFTLPDITQLH